VKKSIKIVALCLTVVLALVALPSPVASQVGTDALKNCRDFAFSTEEDFLGQDIVISDGDLLGVTRDATGAPSCTICARNADLLGQGFDAQADLGLDAVDVIDADNYIVAFSTELDSPSVDPIGFTAGDLLITKDTATPSILPNAIVILNTALTGHFPVTYDIGLDAVHFVGDSQQILSFLKAAAPLSPVDGTELDGLFRTYSTVDILFSTEGTLGPVENPTFLDGDLLSAKNGTIVAGNADLLPASVDAGIPVRGVDFGLDAATTDRLGDKRQIHFSTEILHDGELSFTDGDVLAYGNGVVATNYDLLGCFGPKVKELGLDALSFGPPAEEGCINRITKIAGVDVADIGLADGLVMTGTLGIAATSPFGGRIHFEGSICNDVDYFRVVYRKASSADPWKGMDVAASKGWTVATDAFFPPWPDCMDTQLWTSDGNGWFDRPTYQQLSDTGLGGCNPGLSLTVWESTLAAGGKDALYEVALETEISTVVSTDTIRLVQLDNTHPVVKLEKQEGVCDAFTDDDMPITVTADISDTYFYEYQLTIGGDGYTAHSYSPVAFYDDPTDNVIGTGTIKPPPFADLHPVSVFDLAANPVKCGYFVWLTGWDRTVVGRFTYSANWPHPCVGCRHSGDSWGFEYAPSLP
jgi:hypothetical protein